MKAIGFIIIIILNLTFRIYGQENSTFKPYSPNSYILSKGEWNYSLFSKGEYGLSDKVSLKIHPVWLFFAPSIALKWTWIKTDKYSFSFLHGLSSPTPIMNLLAKKGTGGLISPEFDIPFMLCIENKLIFALNLQGGHKVIGDFGMEFALFNDKLLPGSSIDLPVISPRSAVYYKKFGVDIGLSLEGNLFGKFDYYSKAQGFMFPLMNENYKNEYGLTGRYFGELTGMLFWNTSKRCKVGVGPRLCYGDYPFGEKWHLLPMFDFVRYSKK